MIYAKRDASGKIASVSLHQDEVHTESLPSDAAELVDFLQELADHQAQLAESDMAFIRVLDDLIMVLVEKDLLNFTDLPEAARAKLMQRQSLRGPTLLDDEENDTI